MLYTEQNNEIILQINLDQFENKIVIFSKVWSECDGDYVSRKFKLFDSVSGEIIYQRILKFEVMIGLLESGLFTFVDGHIYYSNDVIKIRYDLLHKLNGDKIKEHEAFDYINDIFDLKAGERIRSLTPIDSYKDHKMAYVIQDMVNFGISTVMLVPYLHDRKIYLNKPKMNTQYFYTSLETPLKDHTGNFSKETLTSIACMNITEAKLYMYNQSGLLYNRVCFDHQVQRYGDLLATSVCG